MSETQSSDVPSYQPAAHVVANTNIDALIQEAVANALAKQAAEIAAANAPKVVSPEEAARAALDNAGRNLGHYEQLAELYTIVSLLASKAGI